MGIESKKYPYKLCITDGGPWGFRVPPFEIAHESLPNPLARQLLEKYRLDEVISGGKTELEKFLLLKEWVKVKMKGHGWSFHYLKTQPLNALEIFEYVEQGVLFHCGYHARVLVQCLEVLGYPSRLVTAVMNNVEFPGKRTGNIGHVVTEVWNNELRKWIVLDSDANVYYEKDGLPISATEICIENINDGGKSVKAVYGKHCPDFNRDLDEYGVIKGLKVVGLTWDKEDAKYHQNTFFKNNIIDYYGIVGVFNRSDYLSNPLTPYEILHYIPKGIYPPIVENNIPTKQYINITDNPNTFNWTVNETVINLTCKDPKNPFPPLNAKFSNNMPNFNYYEARFDGKPDWNKVNREIEWEIKEGKNKLSVRAVNSMGVAGSIAMAEVLYKATPSK